MLNRLVIFVIFSFFLLENVSIATPASKRTMQFSNKNVAVWETVIYPGTQQTFKMHRHEHDRVVVALTDGLLKITNDKGKVHYLKLQKNKAYYLTKDISDELHSDQNVSTYPIKVMVIELKRFL